VQFLLSYLIIVIMFIVVIMTICWSSRIMIVVFWMMHAIDAQTYLTIQSLWRMAVSIVAICVVNTICV